MDSRLPTGAEAVLRVLRAMGVERIFASPGSDWAPLWEALAKPYEELLWDREPLVWKHAAVARGLLTGTHPAFAKEITEHLLPGLSPTQWRRAATSLGAWVGKRPLASRK